MDINSELKEAQLEVLDVDKTYSANTPALIWFNRAANKVKAMYNSVVEILATESYVGTYVTNEINTTIQDNIDAAEYPGLTVVNQNIPYFYQTSNTPTVRHTMTATIGRNGAIFVDIIPEARSTAGTGAGYIDSNYSSRIAVEVDGTVIGEAQFSSGAPIREKRSSLRFIGTGFPEGNVTVTLKAAAYFPDSGGYVKSQGMQMAITTY